jgi:hypothetical protein
MAVEISASMQIQPVFAQYRIRLGEAVIPFRSLGLNRIRRAFQFASRFHVQKLPGFAVWMVKVM